MSAAVQTKWWFEADYIQACNCDYGCPCEFQAPPSMGFCEGTGAWQIREGKFGDVDLKGLGLAFMAKWPKAIHEGGGTAVIMVDEKATGDQRNALLAIVTGQHGGMPFEIIVQTLANVAEPLFLPFQFNWNGRNSSAKIGDALQIETEPIKNPVTGEPESSRIVHETGFIFKEGEVLSGKTCRAKAGPLDFSYPNKAGFVARTRYSN
jgi:hypothetical protein